MIKITNGTTVMEVSHGAYQQIYRLQGYVPYQDGAKQAEPAAAPAAPEKSEDEKFIDEVMEKPISQWNKDEVKRFAALKEIDITGTKNANEAKDRIKEFLKAEEE